MFTPIANHYEVPTCPCCGGDSYTMVDYSVVAGSKIKCNYCDNTFKIWNHDFNTYLHIEDEKQKSKERIERYKKITSIIESYWDLYKRPNRKIRSHIYTLSQPLWNEQEEIRQKERILCCEIQAFEFTSKETKEEYEEYFSALCGAENKKYEWLYKY